MPYITYREGRSPSGRAAEINEMSGVGDPDHSGGSDIEVPMKMNVAYDPVSTNREEQPQDYIYAQATQDYTYIEPNIANDSEYY